MLEKYVFTLYEEQMGDHLLDQITYSNIELKTEVNIFRSSHSSIFFKAPTYLSTVVAGLYPSNNPFSGLFRKRCIYDTGKGDHSSG